MGDSLQFSTVVAAEWSKKAPARHGGTRPQWIGTAPKWVMTPYRAFVLDKIRVLLRSDPDAKLLPCVPSLLRCRFLSVLLVWLIACHAAPLRHRIAMHLGTQSRRSRLSRALLADWRDSAATASW